MFKKWLSIFILIVTVFNLSMGVVFAAGTVGIEDNDILIPDGGLSQTDGVDYCDRVKESNGTTFVTFTKENVKTLTEGGPVDDYRMLYGVQSKGLLNSNKYTLILIKEKSNDIYCLTNGDGSWKDGTAEEFRLYLVKTGDYFRKELKNSKGDVDVYAGLLGPNSNNGSTTLFFQKDAIEDYFSNKPSSKQLDIFLSGMVSRVIKKGKLGDTSTGSLNNAYFMDCRDKLGDDRIGFLINKVVNSETAESSYDCKMICTTESDEQVKVEATGMLNIILKTSASSISSTNTRVLNALLTDKDGFGVLKDIATNYIDKQVGDALKSINVEIKDSVSKWGEISVYSRWMLVLKYYVSTGNTFIPGKEEYDLKKYDKVQYKGSDDKLTKPQDLKLRLYKDIIVSNKEFNKKAKLLDDDRLSYDLWAKKNAGTNGYLELGPSYTLDQGKALEAANAVSKQYQSQNNISTGRAALVSRYADVAKYMSPRVFKVEEESVDLTSTDSAINVRSMQRSVYLDALIMKHDSSDDVVPSLSGQIPALNIKGIAVTENGYAGYRDIVYNMLIVASWAEDEIASGLKKDKQGTITNEKLDKLISDNVGQETDCNISEGLKPQIMGYKNIKEGLEFYGITAQNAWTPELRAIFNYYDKISPFFDNSKLKQYKGAEGEPLSELFSVKDKQMSYYYNLGVALSSTYIPMKTNVYDPNSLMILDDLEFVDQFHYKWGFYRKALFIDTSYNAAVDRYITGNVGTVKVATLKDLLTPEKDIVLYLDDNFYNVKTLAELQGKQYMNFKNTEQSGEEDKNVGQSLTALFQRDIQNVVKTGKQSQYDSKLEKSVTAFGESPNLKTMWFDGAVLSTDEIKDYLADQDYSCMQSFAVVSSIYRHSDLFNIAQQGAFKPSPVFVSSPNLAGIVGVTQDEYNTIFNYLMLRNIKNNVGIDYKSQLDLDSPIYMDIYGNILTESGTVIIPAASNATGINGEKFTPYTVGFLDLYNKGEKLEGDYNNSAIFMKNWFKLDEENNVWEIANRTVNGEQLDLQALAVSDIQELTTLKDNFQSIINKGCWNFENRVNWALEILRGAPQESIDKIFEGLQGNRDTDKFGVYLAYKLDQLNDQLISTSNGNSLISLPNLAFIDGIEYFVVFGYKLLFALFFVILMYKVYIDAITGTLGFKTFASFIVTILVFCLIASGIPNLLNFSYYNSNRVLLQNEMEYIAMLNMEKKSEGREIGVNDITEPSSKTKFYVKLADVNVPWVSLLDDVLLSSISTTMDDVYKEALTENPLSHMPNVMQKANGLYMSLDTIFNSSSVEYNADRKFIYQRMHETPTASYVLPYYVILDQLISNVNDYNRNNNILDYTTRVQDSGQVKVLGMITPYLTSEKFMEEGYDITGMHYVYKDKGTLTSDDVYTEEDITKMQDSLWYFGDYKDEQKVRDNLYKLDQKAREFVANNRNLLGKVTDESFLKMMAMSLSLDHNAIFKVPAAKYIEIFEIDTQDIIRMSLAPRTTVLDDSALSFSRFVYEEGSSLSVVFTAMLIVIYFVTSLIKPLCMMIITALLFISIILHKMILRRGDKPVEGYLITLGLLCGTNLLYALLLKLSFMFPNYGASPTVSCIFQVLLQICYMVAMAWVTATCVADWKGIGYNKFMSGITVVQSSVNSAFRNISNNMHRRSQYSYPDRNQLRYEQYDDTGRSISKYRKTQGLSGRDIYRMMKERDERRNDDAEN